MTGHATREVIWRVRVILLAASGGLCFVLSPQDAGSHEHWMSRQQFRDPVSRASCCDEQDCVPLPDDSVRVIDDGFLVEGKHVVARLRVLPSHDEHYWACFNTEGTGAHDRPESVRCFFAPLSS